MNSLFTVRVKYTKQMDDGTFKRVSEPYLVAAMTFSDAETRIYEELGMTIRGEFLVSGISRTDIHDIFHYPDSDVWYKAKISYQSESEEGSKSNKISQTLLVSAHSVEEAHQRLNESLKGMMIDYTIPSVSLSPLVDIFPFADSSESRGNSLEAIISLTGDLNGREYRNEMTKEMIQFAKENGLVVVYGASDDLTEFSGSISDECGVGELYFDKNGVFYTEDELSSSEKSALNRITSFQTPFSVKTSIPHSEFVIMEDGDVYGTGIVFSLKDLK